MNPFSTTSLNARCQKTLFESNEQCRSMKSQASRKSKSHFSSNSGPKSAQNNNSRCSFSTPCSKSNLFSPGDDIFPDYAVNWEAKNNPTWTKKNINFNRSISPKPLSHPSSEMINDDSSQNNCETVTETEIKSRDESKLDKHSNSHFLGDITEKSDEEMEMKKESPIDSKQQNTEADGKNVNVRRFFRKIVRRMIFIHDFIQKVRKIVQKRLIPDFSLLNSSFFHDFTDSLLYKPKEIDFRSIQYISYFLQLGEIVYNPLVFLWRILDIFLVLFCLFKLPFEASFQVKIFKNQLEISFGVFSLLFSLLSFVVNSPIKLLLKEEKKLSLRKLLYKLLRPIFIIELLGFLAIILHFSIRDTYFSLIYIIKILALERQVKFFENFFDPFKRYQICYSTVRWIFRFCFVLHFLSCLFYILEMGISEELNKNFLLGYMNYDSPLSKYLFGIHFINSNINLFGKSFVNDYNVYKEGIIILLNIISICFLFALYHSAFENPIISEINNLDNFMRKKGITGEMQKKIRNNIFNQFQKENENSERFLAKIEEKLLSELLAECYLPILRSIPLLARNFAEDTLRNLSNFVKEKSFNPGELIIDKQSQNRYLFFILKGEVEILFESHGSEKIIKRLKKGDSFGETAFFNPDLQIFNLKSANSSTLIRISTDDFLSVIRSNLRDYEVYCHLKDSIMQYGDFSSIGIKCFFCSGCMHITSKCPLLFYTPSSYKIINKSNYQDYLFRKMFVRHKKRKKFNAFKYFTMVNEQSLKVQTDFLGQNSHWPNKKSLISSRIIKDAYLNDDNTSSSSYTYTQKKRPNEIGLISPTSDSFSQNLLNKINEERMVYRHLYTNKSINTESIYEHSMEKATNNSSDLRNLDFAKFQNIKNVAISDNLALFPLLTSIPFEEVKIWPSYFPQNNFSSILKEIETKKPNKQKDSLKKKAADKFEEKKSLICLKMQNPPVKAERFQKLKRKPTLRISKTDIQGNYSKKESFFDKIKTLMKS